MTFKLTTYEHLPKNGDLGEEHIGKFRLGVGLGGRVGFPLPVDVVPLDRASLVRQGRNSHDSCSRCGPLQQGKEQGF